MKQIVLFFLLLNFSFNLIGQNIYSPSIPVTGITMEFDQIDDTISISSIGPWDFSSIVPTSNYSMSVLPIDSSIHSNTYVNATHVLKSLNGEFFFAYTANEFLSYGKVGNTSTTNYNELKKYSEKLASTLRIEDNLALSEASKNSRSLIGVYVLDPNLLNLNKTTSEAKNWFLGESLLELQMNWEVRGSSLLILKGDPIKLIPKLAELINADCIYWNKNIEPYEINRDKKIITQFIKHKKKVYTFLDQLIVNPINIIIAINTSFLLK